MRQMEQCWRAMHPDLVPSACVQEAGESDDLAGILGAISDSEESSSDVPLSTGTAPAKKKVAKKKRVEGEKKDEVEVEPEVIFREVLMSEDIYLRLLRYEVSG